MPRRAAIFLALDLLVGCGQRVASAPCPSCPRAPAAEPTPPCPVVREPVAEPVPEPEPSPAEEPADPKADARVLAVLFPKHLKTLGECRRPPHPPMTWSEIDYREAWNVEDGRFVPVIEKRERRDGSPGSDSIRYVVRIDNCQPNTEGVRRIEAEFDADYFTPWSWRSGLRPRPSTLRESHGQR
jgi:hypothetical protein